MLNIKALNITNKIVLLAVGTALFLGITITILFNYIFIKNQAKEVAQLEFLLKQDYDNQIKNHTDIVISMLENFEKFGPEYGLSDDQLESFAAKVLRNVKYGEVGYFWADKSDGQNVFIINSSTEGTNRLHIKDANGLLLVDEIIKAALNGGDFTDYWWPKVKDGDPLPKRGYSAYFKPFDWILGTGNYIDDIDLVLDEHKNSSSASLRKGIILQLIALVIFSIITILLSIILGKKLSRPIIKLASKANLIGEGDLNTYFDINSKDEIGNLADTLNKMVVRLREVVNGIANGLQNISNASQQLSNASEQLSQGANEQASSIEEVSSTMEQITANIQQNTDNATQTEKVSNEANEGIKEVADRSQQAVKANKEIANKITIINDIAFQTNILALNAAVEAARAGEHGKGFAVVAAEVRKLAERSKAAAEEIVGLAQSSLELATGAGEVMMDTIPKIENTTQLVGEISAASVEQNNGAGQVNNAIQQLNSITQQNASSSEELATSAEELATQAEQMNDAIAFFDLGEARSNLNAAQEYRKKSTQVVNKKLDASKTTQGAKIILSQGDSNDSEFENF